MRLVVRRCPGLFGSGDLRNAGQLSRTVRVCGRLIFSKIRRFFVAKKNGLDYHPAMLLEKGGAAAYIVAIPFP